MSDLCNVRDDRIREEIKGGIAEYKKDSVTDDEADSPRRSSPKRRSSSRSPTKKARKSVTETIETDPSDFNATPELLELQKRRDNPSAPFRKTAMYTESERRPIYGCAFNMFDNPGDDPLLASTSGSMVHVYRFPTKEQTIVLETAFEDPTPTESFFTATWCYDDQKLRSQEHPRWCPQRICVAGQVGVIRVLDPRSGQCVGTLAGHGESINELRTNPHYPVLIASASTDSTIRIWNIRIKCALAILGGFEGHRDQVLSVDWSWDLKYIVSSSMDHTLRVWDLERAPIKNVMINSLQPDGPEVFNRRHPGSIDKYDTKVVKEAFSIAQNADLHLDYIDCVRYFGPFCISKGSENMMRVFRWGYPNDRDGLPAHKAAPIREVISMASCTSVLPVETLDLPRANVWFIKYDVDPMKKWICCGNKSGMIHFWDTLNLQSKANYSVSITNSTTCIVRYVTFSTDGCIMAAVCDDGSVVRLDRNHLPDEELPGSPN